MGQIKIFVCEIVAAGKPDLSVNHRNLAVIPVVQKEIQARCKRIENAAANAKRFHPFDKIRIDKPDRAHIIVKYAHLNAGPRPLLQHTLDPLPRLGILDRMVFHKNKLLCL